MCEGANVQLLPNEIGELNYISMHMYYARNLVMLKF